MTAIRSARRKASARSWVTRTMVLPERLPQLQELPVELQAGEGVEGAEGLVEEDDRRIGGEGPGEGDALALASGELGRVAAGVDVRGRARPAPASPAPAPGGDPRPSPGAGGPARRCAPPASGG